MLLFGSFRILLFSHRNVWKKEKACEGGSDRVPLPAGILKKLDLIASSGNDLPPRHAHPHGRSGRRVAFVGARQTNRQISRLFFSSVFQCFLLFPRLFTDQRGNHEAEAIPSLHGKQFFFRPHSREIKGLFGASANDPRALEIHSGQPDASRASPPRTRV